MEDKEKLYYAWNWFEFHANQRLVLFRFFLIFIGAIGYLLVGLGGNPVVLIFSGLAIIILSKRFQIIDVRNRELVECGRKSLDKMEKKLGLTDEGVGPRSYEKPEKRELLQEILGDSNLPKDIKNIKDYERIRHSYIYNQVFYYAKVLGRIILIIGIVTLIKDYFDVCGVFGYL